MNRFYLPRNFTTQLFSIILILSKVVSSFILNKNIVSFHPTSSRSFSSIPSTQIFLSSISQIKETITLKEQNNGQTQKNITLVPLSRYPLILSSSEPILSKNDCKILMDTTKDYVEAREEVMIKVKDIIDTLTNCPSHNGEKPPRLLIYDPITLSTNGDIIPDGLHVDNNNGKLFRHMTILLYLTDNDHNNGCATTFPLAIPINNNKTDTDSNDVFRAARNLISNKIYHTQNQEKKYYNDTKLLEHVATNLYNKETKSIQTSNIKSSDLGIRIIPKAGSICVFYNLLDYGMPDPLTFHGGESCILNDVSQDVDNGDHSVASNKVVLSFFKEIPINSFQSFGEFTKNVSLCRKWLIDRYYQT